MPGSRTLFCGLLHRRFPRPFRSSRLAPTASAVIACTLAACAGTDPGSGVVGLPADEFQIAHNAGLDVAAAEHCGSAVDAGLVRHRLVAEARLRGTPDEVAEKSGRAFDKTRSEFSRRLAGTPGSCTSGPAVTLAPSAKGTLAPTAKGTLALRGKAEFSAPPPDDGGTD